MRLAVAVTMAALGAMGQTTAPLPANYRVVLDNGLVQVQRVHYGPLEFVPMHDHPAVATVLVYLNDSGVVDIAHEGGELIHRPPTHAGAFRIAPGAFERHSIRNESDMPSDFYRIELKQLPGDALHGEFRGPAAAKPLMPGTTIAYDNPRLRIERIVCAANTRCDIAADAAPSVLVRISDEQPRAGVPPLASWVRANETVYVEASRESEYVRVLLPTP